MRTPTAERGTSRPKGPGIVYAAAGIALVVVLGAIALTTREPPPPSIAEFAPQAVEQIRDAPSEQSSEFGSGSGGTGSGEAATPAPAAGRDGRPAQAAIEVPRVRRCVGDPPRQIEDPQSPPCVPYWSGDNGGRTHRGVSASEILVEVPTPEGQRDYYERLFAFFNRRFELYDRRLVPTWGNPPGGEAGNGSHIPNDQIAAAVLADEEHGVFASTNYRTAQGFHYGRELNRRGVLYVDGNYAPFERSELSGRRPLFWTYLMETDPMLAFIGEWACRRLAGRPARHAGSSDLAARTRSFGVIVQSWYDEQRASADPVVSKLRACTGTDPVVRPNPVRAPNEQNQASANDPVTSTNVVLEMKAAGVTTIACLCQSYAGGSIMKAATSQAYFPEWVVTTYGPMDTNWAQNLGQFPPEQMAHAMGLTFQPRMVAASDEPWWWAVKEVNPNSVDNRGHIQGQNRAHAYRSLLLLASGIQMAGPRLTPETFERGLQRASFPNPDHPNRPGSVGFGPSRYAMTSDAAELWWSTTASSPHDPPTQGTFCYVDGGVRRTPSTIPSGDDPFFADDCP